MLCDRQFLTHAYVLEVIHCHTCSYQSQRASSRPFTGAMLCTCVPCRTTPPLALMVGCPQQTPTGRVWGDVPWAHAHSDEALRQQQQQLHAALAAARCFWQPSMCCNNWVGEWGYMHARTGAYSLGSRDGVSTSLPARSTQAMLLCALLSF